MRKQIFLALAAAVTGVALMGCVKTVNDRSRAGVPFLKDTIEDRYDVPLERVQQAAMDVIKFNGTLVNETTLYSETNLVKTVEGKINQRDVWVRVEQEQPKVTLVKVQTRTSGGGTDIDLAHDISKQIALKLASK
jgi:hypothetical protein